MARRSRNAGFSQHPLRNAQRNRAWLISVEDA